MRIIGLDPGLQRTGWGVIEAVGSRLVPVANGVVTSNAADELSLRLRHIFEGVQAVLATHGPDAAAVEETFVNKNPTSTLKLGQVRGVVLLAPSLAGLSVAEYTPNHIKKSVVGAGHADKGQIHHMVKVLLPTVQVNGADAADALAVAICHAHHAASDRALARGLMLAGMRR